MDLSLATKNLDKIAERRIILIRKRTPKPNEAEKDGVIFMKSIYVLSDSTGETAERVIRAALSQFYIEDVRVQRLFQIRTQPEVHQAMSVVLQDPGMVVYTL